MTLFVVRMAGVTAVINLRELRERLASAPLESIYHHCCEAAIRPSFDDPEFRNDFAVWCGRHLHDRVLAERLGMINPYAFSDFEALRQHLLERVDERLAEIPRESWYPAVEEFRFLQAATIVFDTDVELERPEEIRRAIAGMTKSSLYYHFVEARRRTPNGSDDFSWWLERFGEETNDLRQALAHVDFYFLNLAELKHALIEACRQAGIDGG